MTMSFVQPTNIHPAARLAVLGLGASCANRTTGDHRWVMEVSGSSGIGFGSGQDRRDDMFGGGGMGTGAR